MKKTEFSDNTADDQLVDLPVEGFAEEECAEQDCPEGDSMAGGEEQTDDNPANMTDTEPEWKDKYLRLSAEFDNYRKRTLREKMELVLSGGEDVVKAMLPVLDDMDRACDAFASAADMDAMKDGFDLIYKKLHDTLSSKGLAEVPAMGLDMDADLFDAVALVPGEAAQKGKVIDVVQKGYRMKEKVIRHAKVVVGD